MAGVKFVLNSAGVRELLQSAPAVAVVRGRAAQIAARAGEGHDVFSGVGRNRARATVRTGTQSAREREARERNLSRAFGGG